MVARALCLIASVTAGATSAAAQCASISIGPPQCAGSNPFGSTAYVQNGYSDRTVTATVRIVLSRQGSPPSSWDKVFRLSAGQRVVAGCTSDASFPAPKLDFSVVGCSSP